MSKSKTQIDIVKDFLEGSTDGVSGGSGNLKIKGNQLVHYRTPIAERLDDKFIVNITRNPRTVYIILQNKSIIDIRSLK